MRPVRVPVFFDVKLTAAADRKDEALPPNALPFGFPPPILLIGADVTRSICRSLLLFASSAALAGCIAPPNYRSPAGFSSTYKEHLFAQPAPPIRQMAIPENPPVGLEPLPNVGGVPQTGDARPVYPTLREPLGLW
ncbi:MAG: hypothetical protein CMJ48_06860 [Planctomycetaceae bacterium]|nr:hypothetical protein [Planctomycetaceae bacterium]